MRNLKKDFKSNRPLLIQRDQASEYLTRVENVEIPLTAKASDMSEMLASIFGCVSTLEKFPPFAIVPVKGVIGKNLTDLEVMCGCCDLNAVEEMLEDCERDTTITTVILAIDSPGGVSVGVPELAEKVKNFSKKVISFTESEACSAAYWIGSQASEFYATPSSTVGSVGVYIAYLDCSKAYGIEGYSVEVIKSGAYKGAGIEGTSLDEAQRKMLQEEVVEIHNDFKEAVKSVRTFVEDSSMEGQCFSGKKGAVAGLVTGLVNGFDDLMETLDPGVAQQIEADEENDQVAERSEGEEEEGAAVKMLKKNLSASARALAGIKLTDEKPAVGEEEEEEEKKGYPAQPEGETERKVVPKVEEEEGEEGEEEDDKEAEASKEDDDGKCPTCGRMHSEAEADDSDPKDPESEPEEEASPEAKQKAEEENDTGKKPIDTDEKHDRSGSNRNR
jgi:signal peptide peptidase SppA